MASLIRATNLWGYGDLVRELGGDPEPFLSRFRIPVGIEQEDDAFVSFEQFVRMLEASAAELDCPDFGLRLSHWQGLDILGPVAVIARNAHTVLDGMASVARYLYVHSSALKLSVAPRAVGADVRFTFEVVEPGLPYVRQGYELSLANGVRMIRLMGGPEAHPRAISFMHAQFGPDAAYREALDCPVRFGQSWSGFDLPAHLADRRIASADPETRRIATMYLETRYLPATATLSERVATLARRMLPTGQCSVDAIGDELALHPRTLQRQLAAEGVRCQELIDLERRAHAARYLADPRFHLSQISVLVGYNEQSTFSRSCRRWFGKSPRQYRSDLQLSATSNG